MKHVFVQNPERCVEHGQNLLHSHPWLDARLSGSVMWFQKTIYTDMFLRPLEIVFVYWFVQFRPTSSWSLNIKVSCVPKGAEWDRCIAPLCWGFVFRCAIVPNKKRAQVRNPWCLWVCGCLLFVDCCLLVLAACWAFLIYSSLLFFEVESVAFLFSVVCCCLVAAVC